MRMLQLKWLGLGVSLLAISLSAPVSTGAKEPGLHVVVNAANPLEEIDRETLSLIFLKKENRFPNGRETEPVEMGEDTELYEAYLEQIHQSSESKIRRYWVQMMFSGRMMKPRQFKSEQEILEYVAGTPNAVSVVGGNVEHAGVKVIKLIP